MWDYLLVLAAVVLLAFGFIIQKAYQRSSEQSNAGSISFSIVSAIFSLLFLILINGFSFAVTWFSLLNGLAKGVCGLLYTILGFQIMREGKVSLYMLFLMSGGMIVPCIWGWIFLGEPVRLMHVLGILVIIGSIALSSSVTERPSRRLLLKCCAVFVLNGFVSVFIKLHQINTAHPSVGTTEYAMLGNLLSLAMCSVLLVFMQRKNGEKGSFKRHFKLRSILLVLLYSTIGTTSSLLQLQGAKSLPASVLYPMITGGNIVFTGIFAMMFFGEKQSGRGWAGIICCLLGTSFFLF